MLRRTLLFASIAGASLLCASPALAVGESVDGFPNHEERVQHMLANRARVDPQLEMTQCGNNCGEASCYSPKGPLYYKRELNRAARFHAAHMKLNGYFDHTSSCTLVENIGSLYPSQCDGAASCSCIGGQNSCNPACTQFSQRVQLFGSGANGEIIAGGGDAESAFYLWLYEPSADPACKFSFQNGHRWLILTADGAVGFGADGYYVGDFAGGGEQHKIASGSHWPRQAPAVEAWANYFDSAGPQSAMVNVDGDCTVMTLSRGTPENGAYVANISGAGSGCHRYYFLFKDQNGQIVTFPESGSLGIGPEGSCPDWSMERPVTGASCDCTPQCGGKQCGADACGGSCGNCQANETCSADGQCLGSGSGGTGGGGGAGTGTGGGTSSGSGEGGDGGNGADPKDSGGCVCEAAGGGGSNERGLALAALGAGLVLRRRRAMGDRK